MPRIKISPYRLQPPDGHQVPGFAMDYVLHLNTAHLTDDTLQTLYDVVDDKIPGLAFDRAGLIVLQRVHRSAHFNVTELSVDFRAAEDDCSDISGLPPDLLACLLYAASMGFNQIVFEYSHPDDLPYCAALPVQTPHPI